MQVLIRQGELLTGALCKKTVGNGAGGLVHLTWLEHGPHAARGFINNVQRTVNYWVLNHGMSIGIGDTVADAKTMAKVNEIIEEVRAGMEAGVRARPCTVGCRCGPVPGRACQFAS